jgi:hypothetical protein
MTKQAASNGANVTDGSNALEGLARLSFQSFHQVGNNIPDWLQPRAPASSPLIRRGKLPCVAIPPDAILHRMAHTALFFKINDLTHFLASPFGFTFVAESETNGGWIGNVTKRNRRT